MSIKIIVMDIIQTVITIMILMAQEITELTLVCANGPFQTSVAWPWSLQVVYFMARCV